MTICITLFRQVILPLGKLRLLRRALITFALGAIGAVSICGSLGERYGRRCRDGSEIESRPLEWTASMVERRVTADMAIAAPLRLATFVAGARYEDLPAEIVEKAKRHILDTLERALPERLRRKPSAPLQRYWRATAPDQPWCGEPRASFPLAMRL